MRRIISVSRVDGQLKTLTQWVSRKQGRAVIRLAGRRAAVLIPYREYEELQKLRTKVNKVQLLDKLKSLRCAKTD
jgi:PHD/YefM family antitoxin component YafN of YafNO toxin-antitoxin module